MRQIAGVSGAPPFVATPHAGRAPPTCGAGMAYTLHASAPAGSATSRALPPPAALAHGAAAGRAMRRRPSAASGACSAIGSRASGLSGAMGGVAVAARRRPRARLAVCAVSAGQQEALWESQVREGRVKSVDARGAGESSGQLRRARRTGPGRAACAREGGLLSALAVADLPGARITSAPRSGQRAAALAPRWLGREDEHPPYPGPSTIP